jgi:predicted transcriptional regulator
MVARKQLAHIRVNGRLMLPETAIDDYVARNFVEANGTEAGQAVGA